MGNPSIYQAFQAMADADRDISVALNENLTDIQKVKAGTKITFGVPGDVVGAIFSGKKNCCLILWDSEQYRETVRELTAE